MVELEDEILNDDVSTADVKAARKFIERFTYTTTALTALEMALRELGDHEGAELLNPATIRMARHEAETA